MDETQALNDGPINSGWRRGRRIRRVPGVLLREERNRDDYIPKVVSIGPYHHGNPELGFAESFKSLALQEVLEVAGQQEDTYLQEIKKEITEIRNWYEEGSTVKYSDNELARLMLLDACFIVVHMAGITCQLELDNGQNLPPRRDIYELMCGHLGVLSISIAARDMCLVENQIPFWIVKLLLSIYYTPENQEIILDWYLTWFLVGKSYVVERITNGYKLHLLEYFHALLTVDMHEPEETHSSHVNCCFSVKKRTDADLESGEYCQDVSTFPSCLKKLKARVWKCRLFRKAKGDLEILGHSFRSLTELKAKGIHLKPSPTQSLLDVKFKSNFIYAELQLPTLSVSLDTKTLFLNMMCYELDPQSLSPGVVISYINLMKLLIVKPEDVKELREKNILLGFQGSDEEIVKIFQDFNTHGADNSFYKDVKNRIQAHYNSKTKTWKAELIHTYFRSPWTIITLLAATCLLVLTTLQTVYTMKF